MDLDRDRVQRAWVHLLAKNPQLLILIGDNAYPNTTMRSMIWAEHLQQRGVETYAEVMSKVPSVATWDDHDFGPNNSAGADKEKENRDESAQAFRHLFYGQPFREPQAIYCNFVWGDIEFFILDNRYYRTHYKSGFPTSRKMLGDTQWTWFEEGVANSQARFKVIVTGTTLDSGVTETWAADYPGEWLRLRELAKAYRGLVFASGDSHNCEFATHSLGSGRNLHEFSASGIGKGPSYANHAFVTLTFDSRNDEGETVTGRIFRQDGSQRGADITIPLNAL
jgi:alkaline phosphatase D